MNTPIISYIQNQLGNNYEIYDDVKITRNTITKIPGMYRSNLGRVEKGTTGDTINQLITFSIQFSLPEKDAPVYREEIAAMMARTSQQTFLNESEDIQYFLVWTGAVEEGNIVLQGTKKNVTYSIHGECAATNAYMSTNDLIFKISNDNGSTWKILGGIYAIAFDDTLTIHTADDYQSMEMKGKGTKQSRSFQITLMCMKTDAHKILFGMSNDPSKRKNKLKIEAKWGKIGTNPDTYLWNATGTYLMSDFKLALQNNTYASLIVNFDKTRE